MKIAVFLIFSSLLLSAGSFDDLLNEAYKSDLKIKLLEEKSALKQEDIKSSDIWENPMLFGGFKDILIKKPFERDLEPMQTQFIGVSQKIPLTDKFSIKKEIALKQRRILDYLIENEKKEILSQLSSFVYNIEILKKKLELLEENRKNLFTIKRLLKGYRADEDLLLETNRVILTIDLKKETIKSRLKELKEKIAIRVLRDIKDTKISLALKKIDDTDDSSHPLIKAYETDILIAKNKISLFDAKTTPDLTLKAAYNQRIKRGDYLSLSFSMPLLIRDKEKIALQKAKLMLSYQKARISELKNRFKREIKINHIKMRKSAVNYSLYQKRLIPVQKRVTRYLKAKNFTGNLQLSRLIENYNKVISLEQKALDELNEHFKAYSKLRYYL